MRNTLRPDIERVKGFIRDAQRMFSGDNYVFKTAVRELRTEGYKITYHRRADVYTVDARPTDLRQMSLF